MSSTKRQWPILIIDDNQDIHADFRKVLCPENPDARAVQDLEAELFGAPSGEAQMIHQLEHAHSGEEAAELLRRATSEGRRFAMAFVDMRMPPGWDGLLTMRELLKIDPTLPLVVCTAFSDYTRDEVAARLEIRDGILFIRKPFVAEDVRSLADRNVKSRAA